MRRRNLILLIAVLVLALLLVGAYLGAGLFIYNTATVVQANCESPFLEMIADASPADIQLRENIDIIQNVSPLMMPEYETVSFPARDEEAVTISAWYIPSAGADDPADAPVVILVHGLNACKQDPPALVAAGLLSHSDLNVLMIDMRNHGASTVQDGRYSAGNREYRDVLGAYDWLISERGYTADEIGVLGISGGGAPAAIAAAEEPAIRAVVLDSTFADIYETIVAELNRLGFPVFLANGGILMGQLSAGVNLVERSPLVAMDSMEGRAVFITHGTEDRRLTVDYAYDLSERAEAAGAEVETWIIEGLDHVQAVMLQPETYAERVSGFFLQHLGSASPNE